MPLLEPVKFEGRLTGHGSETPISFTALINEDGRLNLELESVPWSQEAYRVHKRARTGESVDYIELSGTSAQGHNFHSDAFHISSYNHSSDDDGGGKLTYQGSCAEAEITLVESAENFDFARIWWVRQLSTFRRLVYDTPLGRAVVGGPDEKRDSQRASGTIALYRTEGLADEQWWREAEKFLEHVLRVLSPAGDTYFRPVIEERVDQGKFTVRVAEQGRTSNPHTQPFHHLNLEPIFRCACASYFDRYEEIAKLDTAIRWLVASVEYDVSRLVNAITALENIVNETFPVLGRNIIGRSKFDKIAKAVRETLRKCRAPDAMINKVPELNRFSFADKLEAFLSQRGLNVSDFPGDWMRDIIRARNTIVHTGLSDKNDREENRVWSQTMVARELVTRIILDQLGYKDSYRSWVHGDELYKFPECRPMSEIVAERETASN